MVKTLLLGLFSCLITHSLLAQNNSSVTGRVTSADGKPLRGALVRIVNIDAAAETDSMGTYRIDRLPAGALLLRFSKPGYSTTLAPVTAGPTVAEAPPIVMQEAGRALDEVVVTSEKREQSAAEVPASVSVLDAASIAAFRLWNVSELSGIVPTLYAADPGDNRTVTSIRGITTTSYDPAVAVYIDGVSQFGLDTYIGELLDPERIEVLRGPQSTLYGRNASGGVISITTRQPAARRTAFAEISAGNYGLQRYKAGLRLPLGKRFDVGAAGMYSSLDGYYRNTFNDSRYDRQQLASGNYFLRYASEDRRWNVTLNAKHQHARNNGAFPLVYGIENALAQPFELAQNAAATMRDRTWNASAALRYGGRNFELHSQTAWQTNSRIYREPIDADFSPADAIRIENNFGRDWNKVDVLTQEIRVGSPAQRGPRDIVWLAGTYLFHQRSPVKQGTIFGADAGLLGSPDSLYRIINTSTATNVGLAFFGQLSLPLGPRVRITGGLRYDRQRSRLGLRSDYLSDKGDPSFVIQDDTSGQTSFGAFSPKGGIVYTPDSRRSLFFNYSRGFRTGGLTQLGTDPSQPALSPFLPEYSNNFELGVKSAFWEKRAQLNLTAFYIRATDVQVPSLILPAAVTIVRNTGALRSYGAEAELQALLFRGMRLQYSFGYTDARYTSLRRAANGQEEDLRGKRQIFTPEYTSMLVLEYTVQLHAARQIQLALRGEWLEFGRQYFDAANTISQAPYRLLNARVALRFRAAEFALWLRNATDTRYADFAYDFGAVHLGNPRTYGATLALRLE